MSVCCGTQYIQAKGNVLDNNTTVNVKQRQHTEENTSAHDIPI